ncbi:MAG: type II CRISPR-associated endonuclease Cas1 [Planctomycetota bacterium]
MIKRTVDVSTRGAHVSISDGQLLVRQGDDVLGSVPVEDLGVLTLSTTAVTITNAAVCALLSAGAVIVPCGDDHLPAGLVLPQNNALQVQRLRRQIDAGKPLRKRLWQQLVRAKIQAQANALHDRAAAKALRELARQVRSGDTTNREAQAARRYWPAFFGKGFRRSPDGPPPNNLLNYGYMALRAAVARAVASAGLHPSLGLHHANRSNTFCLADDLIKPLRPLVDRRVRELQLNGCAEVNRDSKAMLLGVLTASVRYSEGTGPLLVAVERMVASLVECFEKKRRRLEIPVTCD